MMEKPGYKTSEFYLTFLTVLLTLLGTSGLFVETGTVAKVIGWGVAALAAMGYTFVRGSVKKASTGVEEEPE
jgi:hypothetical protein